MFRFIHVYLISKLECRNDATGATLRKRRIFPVASVWDELLDFKLPLADSISTSNNFKRSLYII